MRTHSSRSATEGNEAFASFNETGADLSQYADQLARDRNSRTLTLRLKRPSISSVFNKKSAAPTHRPTLFATNQFPFLDPEYVVRVLSSGNIPEIQSTLNGISTATENSPHLLSKVSNSPEVAESFCNIITSTTSPELLTTILTTIAAIYPLAGDAQEAYIDGGIAYSFLDFLQSNNDQLIHATIVLIGVIAANHSYGRDSLLCTGLMDDLINCAQNETFMEISATAICAIFENPGKLDSEILTEIITKLSALLDLPSKAATEQILHAYVYMTNKETSVVVNLHQIGLPNHVIPLLEDPDLTAVALKAVGNMTVTQPPQIRAMFDLGLMDKLKGILDSQKEYIPDVFWILSNILEAYPMSILPLVDDNFLGMVLETASESGIETKKEACFFLSTVILQDTSNVARFINIDIVEVIVEMLACGVGMITLRCIDTILAFVHHMILNPEAVDEELPIILDTDILDRLEELGESDDRVIAEKSLCLMNQLQDLQKSHD